MKKDPAMIIDEAITLFFRCIIGKSDPEDLIFYLAEISDMISKVPQDRREDFFAAVFDLMQHSRECWNAQDLMYSSEGDRDIVASALLAQSSNKLRSQQMNEINRAMGWPIKGEKTYG